MTIVEYILLAIVLTFEYLLVMQVCAAKHPVALTKGLAESLVVALIGGAMIALGMFLGHFMRFTPDVLDPTTAAQNAWQQQTDKMIYVGLMVVVALRILLTAWSKKQEAPAYDISQWGTAMMLSVVLGINVFLAGLALGFYVSFSADVWKAVVPVAVCALLFSFVGIMFGRQHVALRTRRWKLIIALFVLIFAFKVLVWR